tara:strand:- start:263 stop:466 length:204 start_codon:yes stop_codon:yes gene_type:complete
MAKKKGFGQGSGSDIVDSMVAARPIGNLPTALKIEILKALRGKNPIKKMNNGGAVMAGRGGKFKGIF